MKVAVLGSGIIGVSTAWWLRQAGHDVVVVERGAGPACETSRANGGQIAVSHAEPWANPKAPLQMLRWLIRSDAPLLFRLRLDPAQWAWGLRFLRECLPGRVPANARAMLRMAEYGRSTLHALRSELDIAYHQSETGILTLYRDQAGFEASQDMASLLRDLGVDRRVVTTDEIIELEPALASARHLIAGGEYAPDDESGDVYLFTTELARHAEQAGVEFRFNTHLGRLLPEDGRIAGAELIRPDGLYETLTADAYVAALGAWTPAFVERLGVHCPVYPAKGYSATFDITDPDAAPRVSMADAAHKIVFTRLGNQLRMAGTAELSGYSRALNTIRCDNMVRQARELFPAGLDFANVRFWSGLRPSTPSNVPLVGKTRIPNLYLNTGHGTLGWTMGAGSGRALADIMSGRQPEPEFPFIG
ncbi:D-amino acid dehydrogenase [Allopusillimonas soli]|uniref:D-amino acid dehydrogenase n=1 Tax=Allopusillimonas soli TaxID=659016 RepID=A0A853F8N1_9BURK|nr:D-amino acid dehydrogenase [Allopusillimonas soli]NYT37005.1 D-amino acid dehydrogenase [Allopusillimonas soli]TEA75450.1 D-amino acid dehydrogenase [Allopusillimonas soli]